MKGFVITLSKPDEKLRDTCWGYWTFAPTEEEAWYRLMGHEVAEIERPHKIQIWKDRGYIAKEATLIIGPLAQMVRAGNS